MTHRQWLGWQAWLRDQWNQPDRHDHYLMSIAWEVRNVLASKPQPFRSADYQLEWKEKGKESPMTIEQETAYQKARWFAATGYKPKPGEMHYGGQRD